MYPAFPPSPVCLTVRASQQANLDRKRCMHAGNAVDSHLMQRKADAINA
jgi:hypothetical protein